MTVSTREIAFGLGAAVLGAAIGLATRAGLLAQAGPLPLALIFIGMAFIELAAGALTQTPLGRLVSMPARFAALIAAYAAFLIATKL